MSPVAADGTSSKSGFKADCANPAGVTEPRWGRKVMHWYLAKHPLPAILSPLTNCLRVQPCITFFGGAIVCLRPADPRDSGPSRTWPCLYRSEEHTSELQSPM